MNTIYSPHYSSYDDYPNNTYCVWNVADTGYVTAHIIEQELQEPSKDCNKLGCDCPDHVKITMGANVITLCGNTMSTMNNLISVNGLHVKFCSDNMHTAKGFFMLANKMSDPVTVQIREATKVLIEYSYTYNYYTLGYLCVFVCVLKGAYSLHNSSYSL